MDIFNVFSSFIGVAAIFCSTFDQEDSLIDKFMVFRTFEVTREVYEAYLE